MTLPVLPSPFSVTDQTKPALQAHWYASSGVENPICTATSVQLPFESATPAQGFCAGLQPPGFAVVKATAEQRQQAIAGQVLGHSSTLKAGTLLRRSGGGTLEHWHNSTANCALVPVAERYCFSSIGNNLSDSVAAASLYYLQGSGHSDGVQ